MRSVALGLLLFLAVGACYGADPGQWAQNQAPPEIAPPDVPSTPSLDLLILGDWGTGGEGQRQLAAAMAATYEAEEAPHVTLTVGDNVYDEGVTSVDDPLWESVFTSVYTGPFWQEMTFRPTLGNHDYRGNADAQVEFSSRDPRWKMPSRYYSFRLPLPGGGEALFLALDTNVAQMTPEEIEAQRSWLARELASADAAWVVTYGHHPLAGGGPREPPTGVSEAFAEEVLSNSHIYFAGHEHITQLVETAGALHAICGGGGGTDNPYRLDDEDPQETVAFTGGGWCLLRLWPETAAVELYDFEGRLQYRELVRK